MNAHCLVTSISLAALALAGCAAPPPADPAGYDGPPIECALEELESFPVQHWASFAVTVPTGGYELVVDGTSEQGGRTVALLALIRPRPDELVTQALQTLRQRVRLARRPDPLEVRATLVTRGDDRPRAYATVAEIR